MDKQERIGKTAKEAEPRAIKEVSDESLETVNGGVQPDPRDTCKYCHSMFSHTSTCPLNPKNNIHL